MQWDISLLNCSMSTLSEVNANPLLSAGHLKPSPYLLTGIWKMFERRERKRKISYKTLAWNRSSSRVSLLFYCPFLAPDIRFGVLQGRLEGPWLSTPGSAAFPAFLTPQLQGHPGSLCAPGWKPLNRWQQHPPPLPLGQVCWVSGRALCACRRQETLWDSQKWEIRLSPNTRFSLDTTYIH